MEQNKSILPINTWVFRSEIDRGKGVSPIQIFFCYAREDEILLSKLKAHLRPLQHQGLIDVWHDREISAGSEWEREIKTHLSTAQIILLLISPDFMNSDYCYGVEMKQAMERHEQGDAHVIPLILRPVYWQGSPFGKLQVLPTDAKPITSSSWHSLDDAFFDAAESIRKQTIFVYIQQAKSQGEAYSSSGQHEEALAVYEKALLFAPDDTSLHNSKGLALYDLQRYSEAINAFDCISVFDSKDHRTHNNKGITLIHLERYAEALAEFEQAILLSPSHAEIYKNKCYLLETMQRYPEALDVFDQAFALDQSIPIPRSLYVAWAKKLLTWSNTVFLEIDTTGLQKDDEIVRVLLVNKKGDVLFDTLICPDKHISEKITYLTGITNEAVYKAPDIIYVWEDLMQALRGKYVISFHLAFDQGMLETTAERYHLEMPHFNGECLMKRAMMYSSSFSYAKLSSLCAYIGKPLPKYPQQTALHRAMGQVAVLHAISQDRDIEDPYLEDEADMSRYISQSANLTKDPPIDSRYNKFTKQALNALRIAQKEAIQLHSECLATEHLLLGLIREGEGAAAKVLAALGVESKNVRKIIKDGSISRRRVSPKDVGMTPSVQKVLELATVESEERNHFYIGTEYLLLGLLREASGLAAIILNSYGVNVALAKEEVAKIHRQFHSDGGFLSIETLFPF